VIRSLHLVAWAIVCGTALGAPTPTADDMATSSVGAGKPAGAMASVAALVGIDLRPSEPAPSAMSSVGKTVTPDPDPAETAVSAAEPPVAETTSAVAAASPVPAPPETQFQLASVSASDPMNGDPKPTARANESSDVYGGDATCIDAYLWSLYERAPKVDVNKVTEQKKETVTKDGKTHTVTRTIVNWVLGDFTWKDPKAAERINMPLKDYVIGGLDPVFKLKLYHALRAMDAAGFMPGITSGFRDDYRQSIASGNVAASDRSYHGGSFRGGYGHALAADVVSVKGANRAERTASSELLWKWIDAHEKELGIGRPYLDRDPPHVGPIDGQEYADKRGPAAVRKLGLQTKNTQETGVKKQEAGVKTKKQVVSMQRRTNQPE
jgi:hypothetical protein